MVKLVPSGATDKQVDLRIGNRIMQTFRAYLLNAKGKIIWGDWIEAATEEEAVEKAHALCSKGAPTVELWQGARPVAEIPCDSLTPA